MLSQPNILFLVAEDTGRHQGCYGHAVARTPNLDRLASEGMRFTHAFSTAPVCAPSRSGMVTGKPAFAMGSHHMRSKALNPPKLLTESLRESGYYVNWANKTDFNFDPPESFADETSEWFERLAKGDLPDQPWFLYYNFGVTHESSMWEENWLEKVKDLSSEERTNPDDVEVPSYLADTPEIRTDIARYFDMLAIQDKQVGQALDALDKSGQRDNTIVIYLADHGRGLLREKRWCYDAGFHLPLIVRAPGLVERGAICDEMVTWMDVAPTILDLADAEPLDGGIGRIFFGPNKESPADFVFAGRDRMDELYDRVRAARSRRFNYIRNFFPELPYASRSWYFEKQATTQTMRELYSQGKLNEAQSLWFAETRPSEELYDCEVDPDNVHNLANDPAYAEILAEHRQALDTFLEVTDDLAVYPERELIDRGICADMLPEYYGRVEPIPEKYLIGPKIPPVEMPTKA